MEIQRCKGTHDLSPNEMSDFRLIEKAFAETCLQWGYREVRTPTIEYLHLFTSAGTLTPRMLGKVYSFLDWDGWSGERVVLRPDGTIPVARMYVDSMKEKGLAKLFYVSNIFMFDETGRENRERWQFGAELIGVGSPLADTELISLSLAALDHLNLKDIEVRLSHAGILKALLKKLRLGSEEQAKIFEQILDGDAQALSGVSSGIPDLDDTLLLLLNIKGKSPGFLKNLRALSAQDLPEIKPALDDFIDTVEFIEALGCNYKIDIAAGAGFEYYTGIIFHLYSGGEKLGGGGRYDALVPAMGGDNIPASGFALYFDSLVKMLEKGNPLAATPPRILVRIKSKEENVLKYAFSVADHLRQAGYIAEINLGDQELSGFGWVLDVNEGPVLSLWDKVQPDKSEARTIEEVLALLGERGADKDSLT
ncbi:ATP phosphoribosyltransferase regulatory subunit [Chloroflexota bacterium]